MLSSAEEETRKKTEKSNEIKKINTQIMILKSDIAKMEDTLKEYQLYKKFLDKVTPEDLREERKKQQEKQNAERALTDKTATSTSSGAKRTGSGSSERSSKSSSTREEHFRETSMGKMKTITEDQERKDEEKNEDEDEDEDDDLELFFSDPQQLLDIFLELEEQNLSLIQNSQDTEEALEEMKQTITKTKIKMERETEMLKRQIESLNAEIRKEMEREAELKLKMSYFNYGEFNPEEQDAILKELNAKVERVYAKCIGPNEANITTLQMLTNIENKLEELFQKIEQMPPDRVEEAEKSKEKERRLKQREERLLEQKRNQEERIRKALERARAEPKKYVSFI